MPSAAYRPINEKGPVRRASQERAVALTRQASRQTHLTIQWMVDRDRVQLDRGLHGRDLDSLCPEERWLAELTTLARSGDDGLQLYLTHMMSVMVFDVRRRGELVAATERAGYTHHLAVGGITAAAHLAKRGLWATTSAPSA